MNIINKKEVDSWLFEHSNIQEHICKGIKGTLYNGDIVNIAFIDVTTNERIDLIYENESTN